MVNPVRTLAVSCAVIPALAATPMLSARQGAATRTLVDVVAVDRDGRPVDDLKPADFSATIDGQRRRVLSVTHVSRGAGAESTAMSRVAGGGGTAFAAEPSRIVMVVVDEMMLGRGDERPAIQAANAFLDRLGLDDRVAVVRLPLGATTRVVTTTDRPAIREELAAVLGRAADAGAMSAEDKARADNPDRSAVDPDRVAGGDPDKTVGVAERERQQLVAPDAPAPIPEGDADKARATLGGLGNVLAALQPAPGRKVIALFTAGLPPAERSMTSDIDALVTAAAAARTVVHAFGLHTSRPDGRSAVDFLPLDTLARKTGGSAAMLDKDVARTVERVVQQLSSCYVIALEPLETDRNGGPHAVRVETTRKGVTLRAPSTFVARPDPEERVVAERPPDAPPISTLVKRESPGAVETDLAVSRMTAYVQGYQRAFSGLVAEEEYSQQISGRESRTRSDYLLVKVSTADYWTSFRDVFEVDGKPVRDREDRLKRLFLDNPAEEAMRQVQKVRDESTRLNIGPVLRNFNVPLFPLTFLLPENRERFRFSLADKTSTKGVEAWKIEYEERVRPTLIKNPRTGEDVPAKGYFVMDPMTGTILETNLEAREATIIARFDVHYRGDPVLGLWVPADMSEMYVTRPAQTLVMGGKAKYTNFRRFQVKTEEKVTIPK
jgi:VWFA-related protein